jgi:intergrase/recombinase
LSEVRDLKETARPNALKALSALAKFLGIHEEYKQLVRNYSLKWGGRSAEDLIIDRMTKVESPDEVFDWIKKAKQVRPDLSEFVELMAVTGLRLVEAVESYNLIIRLSKEGRLDEYYNVESGILEHFKFKRIFFRRSKKTFISFVSTDLVERISQRKLLASPVAVQDLVRKQGLKVRFADIRETHATFMTRHLKDNEIDFLHGRVTSNVFMRNYFNPSMIGDLKERTHKATEEIEQKIMA